MSTHTNPSGFPLTAAQLSVWLDAQLNPTDTQYSIWNTVEISGNVDANQLASAIKHVVSSSANFRLQFSGDPLNPRQTIRDAVFVDVPIIDFSSTKDPDAAAQEYMTVDHSQPYDLMAPALFRNAVLKLSTDRVIWYNNYHHLIVDGFAIGLLGMWVAEAYRCLSDGKLPDRVYGDYSNYIKSEIDYRNSPQYNCDREYWSSLYSELPTLVSPSARSRKHESRREVRMTDVWLSRELLEKFYSLSKELNIGVGQIFIGAVALYLHSITRARDVPVCMPTHGRERGPTLEMAGMCTNALPLRIKVDPEQSIAHHFQQLSVNVAKMLEHRRYRYEEIRKDLGLAQGEPVPFRIHANVLRTVEAWVFTEEPTRQRTITAGPVEDLNFMIYENRTNKSSFRVGLMWNVALYEEWEIGLHLSYFHRILEAIAASPNAKLRDVCLVSDEERVQLLSDWNKTDVSWQRSNTFHELVGEQVEKTPSAIAVVHRDIQLTYSQLEIQSTRLASYLKANGVKQGQVVGVCLDRSPDLVVAFLAIMKAGAAYLPLEPDLPDARLNFMAKDADVKCIVTHSNHEIRLPDHLAQLIFVDSMRAEIESQPPDSPIPTVQSSDLAYVIYTSGSTGQPKGVLLQHDGLCNLALAQTELFGVQLGTRVLQFAKLSFDASVSEIAMTLASGGTLVLADKYDVMPGNLGRTLGENQIELVTLPPSVLPSLNQDQLPSLRTLVVAGESCSVELAAEWSKRCRVINAYGPTETTVCATAGMYCGEDVVLIGRPIANTTTYILDEFFKPVPIGVAGELFVGGMGVARGYLNRIELTKESFIPDPFSKRDQSRLYRTGDLARYLPDGNIEFLGRKDQQIKIRGFRVELGEIESALATHGSIQECAVIVRDTGTRKQLVAYAALNATTDAPDSAKLRGYLRSRLPDYMVPIAVVFLPMLPRTPSGKLDKRALPAPDASVLDRPYVEPVTDTEKQLVKIWCEALSVERIGATHNFIDIGGDSLAAVNVIALVWEHLQVDLPPQDIYETADLRELAQRIDSLPRAQSA